MSEEKQQPDHADELGWKLFLITGLGTIVFCGVAGYIIFM